MLPEICLDDENYKDIIEDMRNRIISIYPEWNDFNYHDPGITLLEMFAWIKESQQYFLDQIGEDNYRAFLKLLGYETKGTTPAITDIFVDLPEDSVKSEMMIREGTAFSGNDIEFRALMDSNVIKGDVKSFMRLDRNGNVVEKIGHNQIDFMDEIEFSPFGDDSNDEFVVETHIPLKKNTDYILYLSIYNDYPRKRNRITKNLPIAFAELSMEAFTVAGIDDINIISDSTYAFVQSGAIRFRLSNDMAESEIAGEKGYYIRIKAKDSRYTLAPVIKKLSFNRVKLVQKSKSELEGSEYEEYGLPNQKIKLNVENIVAEDFLVEVSDALGDGHFEEWQQVRDFSLADKESKCYRLDDKNGIVIFGDCVRGLAPEGTVRIKQCYVCKGADGNVNNGVINSCIDFPELYVRSDNKASGGAFAETIEECINRVRENIQITQTAVTLKDYEDRIIKTPGLVLDRVVAFCSDELREFDYRIDNNAIVICAKPFSYDKYPKLSRVYIDNMKAYIEDYRMICSEVMFVQPEYVDVNIEVEVSVSSEYIGVEKLLRDEIKNIFADYTKDFGSTIEYGRIVRMINRLPFVKDIKTLNIRAKNGNFKIDASRNIKAAPNAIFVIKNITSNLFMEE